MSALVFLPQPLGRLAPAGRRLDRFVNGRNLVVENLSQADRRSLANALSAAAIVVETDAARAVLRIRHSQNRMFRPIISRRSSRNGGSRTSSGGRR
jgi:hypothetical protein